MGSRCVRSSGSSFSPPGDFFPLSVNVHKVKNELRVLQSQTKQYELAYKAQPGTHVASLMKSANWKICVPSN